MYYPVKKSPEIKPWFSCELEILFVCQISKSNIYRREEHSSLKRAAPLNSYYCGGARERKKVHHPPPPTGSYLGLWMLSVFWYYVCYFFELFLYWKTKNFFTRDYNERLKADFDGEFTGKKRETKKCNRVVGLCISCIHQEIEKSKKTKRKWRNFSQVCLLRIDGARKKKQSTMLSSAPFSWMVPHPFESLQLVSNFFNYDSYERHIPRILA